MIDEPGGPISDGFRRVGARGHVRQLALDQTELSDRAPELDALSRVLSRDLDGLPGAGGAVGRELETAHVERAERHFVTLAHLTEQVFDRDLHVVDRHRVDRGAVLAQQALVRADRQALALAVHDQRREVLPVDFHEQDEDVRQRRVGDPLLAAVHHVMSAVVAQHRAGGDVHRVRPGSGLGERERRQHLAVHAGDEVALALVLVREVDERQHADALVPEDERAEAAQLGANRAHARDRQHVEVEAAVLLGDLRHEDPQLRRLPEQFHADAGRPLLEFFEVGRDFSVREILERLHDHALLVAQILGGYDLVRIRLMYEEAGTEVACLGRHEFSVVEEHESWARLPRIRLHAIPIPA